MVAISLDEFPRLIKQVNYALTAENNIIYKAEDELNKR
jgi:hypothetical protein